MRTVIAQIIAGLGNQLFQYATARAVSIRYDSRLVLDLRNFSNLGSRAFGLDHFRVKYQILESMLPPARDKEPFRYFIWRRFGLSPRKIRERDGTLQRMKSPLRQDIYLDGYWQSDRYFNDVESDIREDLTFAESPDDENAAHLDAIGACPAVSLHIRRGDYLLPEIQSQYGSCSLSYYTRAVEFIATRANIDPVIFVFSDDAPWARENLRLKFETRVITHNGPDRPHEDLRLMSKCHHHVIANSSFSWWGAWLNSNSDKIVVAPSRWFLNPALDHPHRVPESWYKMDN